MTATEFTLLPAIDVLDGRCVRLHKGDYAAKTEYHDNPVEMAKIWCDQGASYLHVVDLDGAKTGQTVNRDVIAGIVETAGSYGAKVEVGGGIRTTETIDMWLSTGVHRVVLGTASRDVDTMAAWANQFGGERLVAGLDGRGGKLAVAGWIDQTETSILHLATALRDIGVTTALVTDVDRDGTLEGANLALAKSVQNIGVGAIASGGIKDIDDVLEAKRKGLSGAVVGKALYDGRIDLQELVQRLKEESTC